MRLGYFNGYYGNEFTEAVSEFALNNPTVELKISTGSHDELFNDLKAGRVDLVLSDQRRAFSDAYNNEILFDTHLCIEVSRFDPLSKLEQVKISDIKNRPCILVVDSKWYEEERNYYSDVVELKSDFVCVNSIQDARLKIITGQGFMPIDISGDEERSNSSIKRLPLVRNGETIKKSYCAFWKKDNDSMFVDEFANILKNKCKKSPESLK